MALKTTYGQSKRFPFVTRATDEENEGRNNFDVVTNKVYFQS